MPQRKKKQAVDKFVEACTEALRASGARITQPRLSVIRCLAISSNPLTAREVYEIILRDKSKANIDQVSIYRILEALLELGLVHQVFPSGGFLPCFHSKCSSAMHVLIRCSSCERIEELDVPQETVAPMVWYLKKEQNFYPDKHLFQMNGHCLNCRE